MLKTLGTVGPEGWGREGKREQSVVTQAGQNKLQRQ